MEVVMIRFILTVTMFLTCAFGIDAQVRWSASRNVDRLNVDIVIDEECEVSDNRMLMLTPRIVKAGDTLDMSSVGLMGRRRYFFYKRFEKHYPEVMQTEHYRADKHDGTVSWNESVPYERWMNGAEFQILLQTYGCCNDIVETKVIPLGRYKEYVPLFRWLVPEAELVKTRVIKGTAFIDFEVSRTEIKPDYRENRREIGKILDIVDSLRADRDIHIDSLSIKGFASPESPYSNNTRLARERTEALKDYVTRMYRFDEDFIKTSYEPEDWEGLRAFVSGSNIVNRDAVLALIDSDMEPDAKEAKIKRLYPEDYRFLLDVCYPALRHSDYRIVYNIRQYTDIEELKEVFRTAPAKLSLSELFTLSTAYEPGTEEFIDVFEVAVLVYPDDPVANLNAANAAMGAGDMDRAGRFLSKAGDSSDAVYSRGVMAALGKDYRKAEEYFRIAYEEAERSGRQDLAVIAADALDEISEFTDTNN